MPSMEPRFRRSLPERRAFLNLMAVKLLLGNAVFEAPASRQVGKQELVEDGFPSWSLGTSGRTPVAAPGLPSLDARFWHPCRKDGPPTLVHNDETWSLGTSGNKPPPLLASPRSCKSPASGKARPPFLKPATLACARPFTCLSLTLGNITQPSAPFANVLLPAAKTAWPSPAPPCARWSTSPLPSLNPASRSTRNLSLQKRPHDGIYMDWAVDTVNVVKVRRAEPWTGSAECYGLVVSIRRITSPPDGICNPFRNILCNGRSVGRNHGRVPPNVMDRSSAFGGSHPCIRPTCLCTSGCRLALLKLYSVCRAWHLPARLGM